MEISTVPKKTNKTAREVPLSGWSDFDWSNLTDSEIIERLDRIEKEAEEKNLKWYTLNEIRSEFEPSVNKTRGRKLCATES